MRLPQLSIYDYSDYRAFLKEALVQIRKEDPSLTYRKLAALMGQKSHNFINLVIDNKKNVELPTIKKLSQFFKFSESEGHFFRYLVNLNQAANPEDRLQAMEQLMKNKGFLKAKPLSFEQYTYYSDWIYVGVREALSTNTIQGQKKNLCEHFELSVKKAEQILETLMEIGLIRYNAQTDRYQKVDEFVRGQGDINSSFLSKFHSEMIAKAGKALFEIKPALRDVSSVTLPVQEKDLSEAKIFIENFRAQFMAKFNSSAEGDAVYQLNVQLFPLISWAKRE